jgi:hypothetical protein
MMAKAMRLILLDEAGRASRVQEPFLVVAGVIIDPDKMWKRLDTYFRDIGKGSFFRSRPRQVRVSCASAMAWNW